MGIFRISILTTNPQFRNSWMLFYILYFFIWRMLFDLEDLLFEPYGDSMLFFFSAEVNISSFNHYIGSSFTP